MIQDTLADSSPTGHPACVVRDPGGGGVAVRVAPPQGDDRAPQPVPERDDTAGLPQG